MDTSEVLRVLGAFGLGSLLAAAGTAGINHVLSVRRWERERRSSDVAYWHDFLNRYVSLHYEYAERGRIKVASTVPVDLDQMQTHELDDLREMNAKARDIKSGLRRAPEPLTAHTRLFADRLSRSYESQPPDHEFANFAIMQFRQALDEYVRRGKAGAPKLRQNESWPDDPY